MLHPRVETQGELNHCSLVILLKDSDLLNADDILGSVVLRFPGFDDDAAAFDGKEFAYDFNEPIVFEGTTHKSGRLTGTIKVSWTDSKRREALDWYESEYSDGCSCCTQCPCTIQ